jgi:hypothetical protein
MFETSERRGSPRAKFSGAVIVCTPMREVTCLAANLSETGMLLFPPRDSVPAIGMPVQVRFTLPRLYRWLTCHGTVVREASVQKRLGWGVAFRQAAPEIRRAIRTFVVVGHGRTTEFDPEGALRRN